MTVPNNPNPHDLREQWRHYCREHKKQRILADVMDAFITAIGDVRTAGAPGAPSYATPELVDEALREGIEVFRTAEQVLAQLEQDAYDAFNAAVQQN